MVVHMFCPLKKGSNLAHLHRFGGEFFPWHPPQPLDPPSQEVVGVLVCRFPEAYTHVNRHRSTSPVRVRFGSHRYRRRPRRNDASIARKNTTDRGYRESPTKKRQVESLFTWIQEHRAQQSDRVLEWRMILDLFRFRRPSRLPGRPVAHGEGLAWPDCRCDGICLRGDLQIPKNCSPKFIQCKNSSGPKSWVD